MLGRASGPRGEIMLRHRASSSGAVKELVVNGVFAMDSTETTSERQLAGFALLGDALYPRVLVGGLGLGYTAAALLEDQLVAAGPVDIVELEGALVAWALAGLTPTLARVAADPRVSLHEADVTEVLLGRVAVPRGPWDAVLLAVDNGPDFLIHDANNRLYQRATLQAAYGQLAPGGVLAVWCQGPAAELHRRMRSLGSCQEHRFRVERQGRSFSYVIYALHREPVQGALPGPDVAPGSG